MRLVALCGLCIAMLPYRAAIAADMVFDECVIIARRSAPLPSHRLDKYYLCKQGAILLVGEWANLRDIRGEPYRQEFGHMDFGEHEDFDSPSHHKLVATLSKCARANGGQSNGQGYLSLRQVFNCGAVTVELNGWWGIEIQGHWEYHLDLGEVTMEPQWVSDKNIKDMLDDSFQKWCRTKYGYRLCGFVDQPRIDHGKPPEFKRE